MSFIQVNSMDQEGEMVQYCNQPYLESQIENIVHSYIVVYTIMQKLEMSHKAIFFSEYNSNTINKF